MPYAFRRLKNGRVRVRNRDTGRLLAKATTAAKARRQRRLLAAIEHDPSFRRRR